MARFICLYRGKRPTKFTVYQPRGSDNGIPVFKEEASKYGLDDKRICTQAAFFDYDQDNDLDLFVIVNSQLMNDRNQTKPRNNGENSYTVDIFIKIMATRPLPMSLKSPELPTKASLWDLQSMTLIMMGGQIFM